MCVFFSFHFLLSPAYTQLVILNYPYSFSKRFPSDLIIAQKFKLRNHFKKIGLISKIR